jgi:DNA-binding beta-propeller fold protein YncE
MQVIPLAGEAGNGALLIDSAARRLYVARSNSLLVLDIDSGRSLAEIKDLPGIAGIAVAQANNRGYVTNSKDDRVSIFELTGFGHLGQIPLGRNPGALVYDSSVHRFYAMNRGSKNASAIDADDGEVEQTIDLGGIPAGAVADDHGRVFIVLEDRAELVEIDAKKMAFSRRFAIPGCTAPRDIALDETRARLFIGCAKQRLAVISTQDGNLLSIAGTGSGGGGIATDTSSGLVYVANTSGGVTILADSGNANYQAIETVVTAKSVSAIAFDAATRQLFALASAITVSRPGPNHKPEDTGSRSSQLFVLGK